MKKLTTLQTNGEIWHNVELYPTAGTLKAQGFELIQHDYIGDVYGIRNTKENAQSLFLRIAFVPEPIVYQKYFVDAIYYEQITHVIETANNGLLAITDTGATRWTGWEELQRIADGNNPDTTNSAREDAAKILKRKKEADDLRDTCKREALELDAVAAGFMLICPECGGKHHRDDYIESENEDGETVYTCPSCGATVDDLDDLDALTLSEYLADNFDTEYRINDGGGLRSVQIMTACGGPNIYIDTERRAVCLHWWGSSAEFPISYADDVEEVAREWWEALRS